MANAVTAKDVLYALEYGGKQLCRWPHGGASGRSAWSLEPGGERVSSSTAEQVCASGRVMPGWDGRYGESRYMWKPE